MARNTGGIDAEVTRQPILIMNDFAPLLMGKDLRTIKKADQVAGLIDSQQSFDSLFALLFHHERPLVMRAADAVEKVTIKHREFLIPHKQQLMSLLKSSVHIELKWHLAQLVPRLPLDADELKEAWSVLSYWTQNPNESKIVRVNSLQGLFDLSQENPSLKGSFKSILHAIQNEPIPSLQARIRKLGGKHSRQ
jgi:hypothetical protein